MVKPTPPKSMTLEEARKVHWIRPYRKPLGELLDQGYLDQSRLQWAAEKAYNVELRQAAQVILDWQQRHPKQTLPSPTPTSELASEQPALALPITLEQARATLWPFQSFKNQPMGTLVDTRQLSLKDLAYAIENAWDQRVKQAAIALLSVRLQQAVEEPTPSAGALHVHTAGRSFSQWRQFQYVLVEGVFAGFLMGLLLPSAWEFVSKLLTIFVPGSELNQIVSRPAGVIGFIIVIVIYVIVGVLTNRFIDRLFKPFERRRLSHRKGEDGEQRVIEVIQSTLDGTWHLFRNLSLPGENKTDLDAILVGPAGVWALEVKNLTGEYRNVADLWEYRIKGRWRKSRYNPSKQAQKNAARLANFLRADSISQWVTPTVIWANAEASLLVDNPQVVVWKIDRLADELGNLWQESKFPDDKRQQIVNKLIKLCEAQIKARYED